MKRNLDVIKIKHVTLIGKHTKEKKINNVLFFYVIIKCENSNFNTI